MKRIYLRVVPNDQPPLDVMAWADVIRQVIRRPLDSQRGADIDELRRGIRVLDALDAAKDRVLALEDADYDHLKAKTLAMQWGLVDRRVLSFIDDVLGATEGLTLEAQLEQAARADGQAVT